MSAYPNEMAITMRADGRIAALLDKPLDGDVLQAAVRTAVAGR
jgi:hypothetical protein